jgi:hypothetical protein
LECENFENKKLESEVKLAAIKKDIERTQMKIQKQKVRE